MGNLLRPITQTITRTTTLLNGSLQHRQQARYVFLLARYLFQMNNLNKYTSSKKYMPNSIEWPWTPCAYRWEFCFISVVPTYSQFSLSTRRNSISAVMDVPDLHIFWKPGPNLLSAAHWHLSTNAVFTLIQLKLFGWDLLSIDFVVILTMKCWGPIVYFNHADERSRLLSH